MFKKDYTMSDDKIYNKYGKIVSMYDELQIAGCFDTSFSQPVFRIAICGPNQCGKDSFINCLLGYPFLPVNCKTQRQMEIRIVHSVEEVSPMVHVDEINKTFTQFRDSVKGIADLQNATNDSNRNISIKMSLTSNTSADLTFISCCEKDDKNAYWNSNIRDALAPSCNFIILVLDANILQDENIHLRDQWFNLVKNYDRSLERTMVVFTKTDLLPNNFNFNKIKQFLKDSNDTFSPKYGFVCCKTNFPAHIEPPDQARLEREYFCNHKTFQFLSINDYFTLDTVGEKITKWIYEQYDFKKCLIYAYGKLQERMTFVDSELQKYGSEFLDFSSQSKDLYLQSLINVFCETVEKTFSGKCEIEEYNICNTNLRREYMDFLGNQTEFKPSTTFKDKDIIETIQKTEDSALSGFPSGDVIYALLDKVMEELRNELRNFLDRINDITTQLIKNIIQRYFARFPKAINSIEELIIGFCESEFNKTKKLQTDLSEMNFTYIYIDELSDKYQNLMQESFRKGMAMQNAPQNTQIAGAAGTKITNFKENKDISFFKSAKDKDSYYQSLAEYVKSLVDFIYAEMVRNLREYIPKASGNFFIKSLKTNMRFFLLQYISKNPEFSQELEEDQDVAQKRTYYIDSQKRLKKIFKNISYDDQITKIVKGDNIKSIDNILQSQGINTSNSNELREKEEEEKKKKEAKKNETKTTLFGNTNANKNITNNNSASNLFGVPPKKETAKTNLFGNTTNTNTNTNNNAKAATNLFGKPTNANNTNNNKAINNLFGTGNTNTKKTTNLFGTPQQGVNRPTNNLFGNPSPNIGGNQNKGLNLNLGMDKSGNVGVKVSGQIDPKDAYNFYQQNKQYMPSGKQMMAGAAAVGNFMNQANNNNQQGGSSKGLMNLFGTGGKKK